MHKTARILFVAVSLAVTFALACPVLAQTVTPPKPKQREITQPTNRMNLGYRGQDKFRAGPIYEGNVYLGDDPDPFIRLQLYRDLAAKLGGNF